MYNFGRSVKSSSFMSPAKIFLFGKTKLSKTLMPALVPWTVIMIAEIKQYSQRLAHFEMQWGRLNRACV